MLRQSDGKLTSLDAAQISGFYIEPTKQLYVSRNVRIDHKPVDFENLEADDEEPKFHTADLFLMMVVQGEASLLYHKDFKQHFFIEQGDSTVELLQLKYRSIAKSSVETIDTYKKQLNVSFAGCLNVPVNVPYSVEALSALFVKYNSCKSGANSTSHYYETKADSIRFYPVIIGGAALSFVSINGPDEGATTSDATKAKFGTSFSPIIGVGIESNPRRSSYGFSWGVHGYYRSVKFTANYLGPAYKSDITIGYGYARVCAFFRKSSDNHAPLKKFLTIGLSSGLAFNEVNNMKQYQRNNNDFLRYDGIIKQFSKWDVGLVAGGGVRKKRMAVELRLEQIVKYDNDTIKPINVTTLWTTTIGLMASYVLGDLPY